MTGTVRHAPPVRPLLIALVALALFAVIGLPSAAAQQTSDAEGTATGSPAQPQVEDLTPWASADGYYAVRVRLPDGYPAGRLQARVFRTMESGAEVRELEDPSRRYRWATYDLEIPEGASTVTLQIPLGEGEDQSSRLHLDAGVYPVLLEIFPDEGETWQSVTYLTRLPDEVTARPVALVVPVEAPLHWSPGGVTLAAEDLARIRALAATLAAWPEVPVTLAIEPALVTALGQDPAGAAVLDQLADIGRRGEVLNAPYADVDAGAWAGGTLEPELVNQFTAGETVLTDLVGRSPDRATWIVDAGDSPALLSWLRARDVARFLLAPGPGGDPAGATTPLHLEGIAAGHRAYAAAAVDAALPATGGNPVLQANHLLAALSVDALGTTGSTDDEVGDGDEGLDGDDTEDDTEDEAVPEVPVAPEPLVLLAPLPAGGDLTTLTSLLRALGEPGMFEPVTTSSLATTATTSIGVPQPPPSSTDLAPLAQDLGLLHGRIASYVATVGDGDPTVADLRRSLLVAGRSELDHAERARYLSDVEAVLRTGLSGVELADSGALTVTSHRARLPVTLHNTSGRSLQVAVRAESSQLAMLGAPVTATLAPGATEDIEIPFRVSRSGDFAVRVTVTSPDGAFVLTSQDVTLRSTAVSGVGIVLSVGALAFLGLWWGRSFRRRRVTRTPRNVPVPSPPAPHARVRQPVP